MAKRIINGIADRRAYTNKMLEQFQSTLTLFFLGKSNSVRGFTAPQLHTRAHIQIKQRNREHQRGELPLNYRIHVIRCEKNGVYVALHQHTTSTI